MAVVNSSLLKKASGSVGGLTLRNMKGKTILSEKITQTTNTKSEGQLRQRMKWANIVRTYQQLAQYMRLAFGGTQDGCSDYNKYVRANLAQEPVYVPKNEVSSGACLVAPYFVTQGILPGIAVSGEGNQAKTSVSLGSLNLSASTTVADFANAVVANNRHFNYGDQITWFLMTQEQDAVTEIPMASIEACAVVLDKTDTAKLWSVVDQRGFSSQDGYLAAKAGENFGNHGMVWVLSRKQNGKTLVSTQVLIVQNALLAAYQGDDAYDAAVRSYGGSSKVYLTPGGVQVEEGSSNSSSGSSAGGNSGGNSGGTSGGSNQGDSTVKYTLSLAASPAEGGTVTGAGQYNSGTSPSVNAVANSGYTFARWSDGVASASRIVVMTGNKTLSAIFTATAAGGDDDGDDADVRG